MSNETWDFRTDRGGTFTDPVARTPSGTLRCAKLLSESDRNPDVALQSIRDFLGLAAKAPIPAVRIGTVKMGTTVATNALLERKGDRAALVIIAGLAEQLRIAYQNRLRLFDREIVLPEMLYERVIEARERVRI